MIQVVAVLCLFINGELVEHRYQQTLSDCLKHKRISERNLSMDNKRLSCGTMEAVVKKNTDGSLYIEKIIMDEPDK